MNFAELQTELYARGFDFLNDSAGATSLTGVTAHSAGSPPNDFLTKVAHGLTAGLRVYVAAGTAGVSGLEEGLDYYVLPIDADHFGLALTLGGDQVSIAADQTGLTITYSTPGVLRAKAWVQDAYAEICDQYEWPFLEAETTATGTVALTDLKTVIWVVDSTNKNALDFLDRRTILERVDTDLTTVGTPTYWYLNDQTIAVYPASSTTTLDVKYIKVPAALVSNGDTPLIPARYHQAIVDGAVRRALLDNNDTAEAQAVEQERQIKLANMLASLSNRNAFETDHMASTGARDL